MKSSWLLQHLSCLAAGGPLSSSLGAHGALATDARAFFARDARWIATGAGTDKVSGPLYPKVKAFNGTGFGCGQKNMCLFDIETDPWERENVAAKNEKVVSSMAARLDILNKGAFEGKGPGVPRSEVCDATLKNGHYLTPSDWKKPEN